MFSDTQLAVLCTVVNRIIPEDDYPAGWEAGVGDYLLRQLERDLNPVLDQYRLALDALEAEAQAYGSSFVDMAPAGQDALLAQIEQSNTVTEWTVSPADFFAMLVEHCAEGFYSDPNNGGNRDQIAWQMIGFEVRG